MNGKDPDANELFAEEIAARLQKHLKNKWGVAVTIGSKEIDGPPNSYGICGSHNDVAQRFQIGVMLNENDRRPEDGHWIIYTMPEIKAASFSQIVQRIIASGCTKDVQPL